ncbi:MAG: diaminopimelate epimerase [Fimbriimonadaceae bacterium]
MRVPFAKVESIGNDFVLVEPGELPDSSDEGLRLLAIQLCRRRFGIGADGLLLLSEHPAPSSPFPRLLLRMFNPDGTEDFCGNGLRCAAVYARHKGWVECEFTISHGGKEIQTSLLPNGCVRTGLGKASFKPQDVPLDECSGELYLGTLELQDAVLTVSSLTTGSTHTVILCDELPPDKEFIRLSRQLEHHQLFPARTSVIWAAESVEREAPSVKAPDPPYPLSTLRIRIWERGAGETLGCGTGSSAAAVVHMRRIGRGGTVVVENPGGPVLVSAESCDAAISVEGPARIVYFGSAAAS